MVDNDLQGAGRSAPQSGTGQGQRATSQAMGSPGQSPHKVPDVPAADCVRLYSHLHKSPVIPCSVHAVVQGAVRWHTAGCCDRQHT